MFDTDSTPTTVLETLIANATSESPLEVKPTTKLTTIVSNTNASVTNDNDKNIDDDQVVLIPLDMFDTDPTIGKTLVTKVTSDSPIKVELTTKLIPTLVSNTYACLTNDNNNNNDDDNDEFAGHTAATNRVPRTGKSVQGMNN